MYDYYLAAEGKAGEEINSQRDEYILGVNEDFSFR